MGYKETVKQIANLEWGNVAPGDIILLSRVTAQEFAESLRLGATLYPGDTRLAEMISGELETDNMAYEDYQKRGDHWQFLDHFIHKHSIKPSKQAIEQAASDYVSFVSSLVPTDRAMTVFSREEELTLIFRKIVDAHDWDGLGLGFYKYYLEQHILFDSGTGGHHHLTQHFPLHEEVLDRFYEARLKLYQSLF